MNKVHNPPNIAPPYRNRYNHGIEVAAGSRMLFTAGTVGVKPDGEVPADFAAQVETVMTSLTAILKSAGMTWDDVVKLNGYLTPEADVARFAEVRAKYLTQKPAMTVVFVPKLVDPRWMVEVEIVAAK
jgi:enamine deaminase RidA (YjgF/YER057c/UK114 family)